MNIIEAAKKAGCNDEFIKMAPDWLERFAAYIREALAEQRTYPNLEPVINWLEKGCDPKEAAKELRIYAESMKDHFAASGKPIDHIADADKMIGCAYCDNPLFAGTKCNNCGRLTLAKPVENQDSDDRRLLREIFMLCEATEEIEATNDFMRGRVFEAKGIRRGIGTWYQDTFCGRSYMGEPVIPAAPVQPVKQDQVVWHHPECKGECIACLIERCVKDSYGTQGLDFMLRHINAAPVDAKAIRAEALEEAAKHLAESGLIGSNDCAAAIRNLSLQAKPLGD